MKLSKILFEALNNHFWDQGHRLFPDIRERLLKLAKDFQANNYIPDDSIVDIVLTGSIANSNWTDKSDIDLHIIVNFSKIDNNEELLRKYYRAAKSSWNNAHDITICDHVVEIYVQDVSEAHYSTGVYSLLHDDWITTPKLNHISPPDKEDVARRASEYAKRIKNLNSIDEAEKLKEELKTLRKLGLAKEGEYSAGNMIFKRLRDTGYLEMLVNQIKDMYDAKNSLECT